MGLGPPWKRFFGKFAMMSIRCFCSHLRHLGEKPRRYTGKGAGGRTNKKTGQRYSTTADSPTLFRGLLGNVFTHQYMNVAR